MTPEYTPGDIAMILRCLRVQTEGPGPICPVCVHQAGLVAYERGENQITGAGRFILALDQVRRMTEVHGRVVKTLRAIQADPQFDATRDVEAVIEHGFAKWVPHVPGRHGGHILDEVRLTPAGLVLLGLAGEIERAQS